MYFFMSGGREREWDAVTEEWLLQSSELRPLFFQRPPQETSSLDISSVSHLCFLVFLSSLLSFDKKLP